MKVIRIEDSATGKISDAESLLKENGFTYSIVEIEQLAEQDTLVAKKNLEFQISQLEHQISELEDSYQMLSKRVRGFVKMDLPSCTYTIVDQFLEELSGFPVATWMETPDFVSTIVHSEFKEYFLRCCEEMKRGIIPKLMDYKIIRKDGEERWWLQFNIGAYNIHRKLVSVSAIIIDNTDSKNAELKLKENEERFRSLVEQSVAGIILVKDKKIIFANEVISKHSGYSLSRITSLELENFQTVIHPEDLDSVMTQFKAVEEQGIVPEFYFRIITPCKKIKWLSAQLKKFSNENNSTIAVVIVEVTKRIELEQKLQHEHNLARSYFDIAGSLLVVLDRDANVVQINKRGCEILGYTQEEIIGRNWIQTFLPSRIQSAVQRTFDKCIAGEISSKDSYENYVLTKDGEERLVLWYNAVLKDSEGNIDAVISSGEDITIPRLAEKILGDNEIRSTSVKEDKPVD